jgi:hypothetical protein
MSQPVYNDKATDRRVRDSSESWEGQELFQNVQTGFGAHLAFGSVGTGVLFSGGMAAGA